MRNLHMLCEIQRTEVARQIWSTSWSPIITCYISFLSSRSQESNTLNGVQFGAEKRKLWPFEGDCTKLRRNFALTFPDAKISALTSHDISQCEIFHTTYLPCENVIARYFTLPLLDLFTLRYLV